MSDVDFSASDFSDSEVESAHAAHAAHADDAAALGDTDEFEEYHFSEGDDEDEDAREVAADLGVLAGRRAREEEEEEDERPVQRRRIVAPQGAVEEDAPQAPEAAALYVNDAPDHYPHSEDECFHNLDDYFELLEHDRKRPEGMSLPAAHVEALTVAWCMEALDREVDRLCMSECYKRRTVSKVLERFVNKNHVDRTTFALMQQISAPISAPQDSGVAAPESFGSWLHRLRFEHETSFFKLCLLYSFHRNMFLEQFAVPGSVSVLDLTVPVHVCLQRLRTALLEHAHAYFVHLCASPGMQPRVNESDDEDEGAVRAVRYSRYHRLRMASELQRYAKPLYRLRLIGQLGLEARSLRTGSLCLRRLLGVGSLVDLVVSYVKPNYWNYPVRGPFRAGFQGSSELPGMYGRVPNPMFWYCDCMLPRNIEAGVVCGHAPLCVRVRSQR